MARKIIYSVEEATTTGWMTREQMKVLQDNNVRQDFDNYEEARHCLREREQEYPNTLFQIIEYVLEENEVVEHHYREESKIKNYKLKVSFRKVLEVAKKEKFYLNHTGEYCRVFFPLTYRIEKDLLKIAAAMKVSVDDLLEEK